MFLLALSLAVLIAGPFIHKVAGRLQTALAGLDGFTLVAIGGLVLFHIIPHSVEEAGPLALIVAFAGTLGPGLTEKAMKRAARSTHLFALVLALVAIAMHAFLDGTTLGGAQHEHEGQLLSLAVVLHRLPEGLTIWWLLRPNFGSRIATVGIGVVALATILGFFLGGFTLHGHASTMLGLFQALVAGSLLHVVVHRPKTVGDTVAPKNLGIFSGIGALLAVAMLYPLLRSESVVTAVTGELEVSRTFLALALRSAPALLLAYLISGLAQSVLPGRHRLSSQRGSAFAQALRGAAIGLPTPIGTRSALPIYNSLLQSGVSPAAALAFLVTAPVISFDAILISIPLLGPHLAIVRVCSALIIAILVSLVLGRSIPQIAQAFAKKSLPPQLSLSFSEQLLRGLRLSVTDVVDRATPWLLIGLVIASFAEPLIRASFAARIPSPFDIALFSTVGLPVYLCASGATPIAAIFLHKGVAQGAVIAFLLTGPIANVSTFSGLYRLHGLRIAITFGAVIVGAAIGLGWLVSAFLPVEAALPIHSLSIENATGLQFAALGGLGILVAMSLLRQGPRGFLDQVLPHHDHDHGTEDCCGEADGHG